MMPRKLPWLAEAKPDPPEPKNEPSQRRRSGANRRVDSDGVGGNVSRSNQMKRGLFRSSPSPPSSPIHQCPSEEFLIEGFDRDDAYMMVEDEFYAVAQTFTQHLHYAEYVRRKKEAKLQNAATIRDIARPTDGRTPMTDETRQRNEADELSARQKAGLEKARPNRPQVDSEQEDASDHADNPEEDSWAGTSLYDLMMSPRKARSLVGIEGIKSSTRAAAGYSQTSTSTSAEQRNECSSPPMVENSTASEDDDLDGGQETPSKKPSRRVHFGRENSSKSNLTKANVGRAHAQGSEKRAEIQSISSNRQEPTPTPTTTRKRKMLFNDNFDDELPELHNPDIVKVQDSRPSSRNQGRNAKKDDSRSKKSRLNEVPTFLL